MTLCHILPEVGKTAGKEARRQLHKNAAGNLEQVLAATPTRHQLYGHLPPITKTIQVRRARHAGPCWRSRDELISDVLLWTSTHGRAKAGLPARTYIQQLCEDTGYCPEDLPETMNDREKWRESVMISVLPVRHDDDDELYMIQITAMLEDSELRGGRKNSGKSSEKRRGISACQFVITKPMMW